MSNKPLIEQLKNITEYSDASYILSEMIIDILEVDAMELRDALCNDTFQEGFMFMVRRIKKKFGMYK